MREFRTGLLAAALAALAPPVPVAGAPEPPAAAAAPSAEPSPSSGSPGEPSPEPERWCAPELAAVDGPACFHAPTRQIDGAATLVVFLHGVIKPESGWQWAQQRAAVRAADAHGFAVLTPRGRRGWGPKDMRDWWTWPTGAQAQAEGEAALIEGWALGRRAVEASTGQRFERVWVFGFSNGAYYAADLALRARLSGGAALLADGFAAFAGGSGAAYLEHAARAASVRAPIFVGWGGRDGAHGDQEKLGRMLRGLGWPALAEGAPRAGHVMADRHVADAVRFLAAHHPVRGARRRPGR